MLSSEKHKVIEALAIKYPLAITAVPHEVKPLTDKFVGEIFFDLGKVPKEFKRAIIASILWYKTWPDYLRAVAFGEYKVNIHGHKILLPSIMERENAREELKKINKWNKRCETLFKVNMGRKEAANRQVIKKAPA